MGFAIVGYFDEKSSVKIEDMWKRIAENQIDDYLIKSKNSPHFKFVMSEELDVEFVRNEIMKIVGEEVKVPVHFKKFGFYPNKDTPFLTLDLAENEKIIQIQKRVYSLLKNSNKHDTKGFFESGIWKPDIQLTVMFDKCKLPDAVKVLNEITLPFDGVLESIGLIEFYPAEQLFRYEMGREVKK